jgi:hypothetical protein
MHYTSLFHNVVIREERSCNPETNYHNLDLRGGLNPPTMISSSTTLHPPLQWPFGRRKVNIIHTATMRGCKMAHPLRLSHNVTGCPPNSRLNPDFPYIRGWSPTSRLSVIDRIMTAQAGTCPARRSTQRKENMGNDHPRQEQHHRKMNLYTNFEVRRQSFEFYNLVVFQWPSQRFGGRRSPRHRWG